MNVEGTDCPTALFRAVERGEVTRAVRLLAGGADPNGLNAQGSTPLMVAALGTNVGLVHALVAAGADVDRLAADGSTALMTSALWGCVEVVVALLRLGADPTLTDDEGWTAARIARARGHRGIAQLLDEWQPAQARARER